MKTSLPEVPGLSLRANFSWTFTSNLVYGLSQWGMLAVLAKLVPAAMVGQFALGMALSTPVFVLSRLHLRSVQATDARREYQFADYLGLRLITTALALLITIGIAALSGYRHEAALVILAVSLSKVAESLSDVYHGLQQQHERMDRVAVSIMLKGVLALAVLTAGVALTGSVFWGTVGLAGAWGAVLLFYDIRVAALTMHASHPAPDLRPRWHTPTLLRLTWLALPLGFVMMLNALHTNIPRYFIERALGEAELGIFVALFQFVLVSTTIVTALGQSASPRLARYYAAGERAAFVALLLKLLAIGVFLGMAGVLVAALVGRDILALLYRPEYARQDVLVWLMVAAGVMNVASFLGYGITAARFFKAQVPLFLLVAGATALACFWLVPLDGLRGAAVAFLAGALVLVAGGVAVLVYALYAGSKAV